MGMFSFHLTLCRNLCSAFSTMSELLRDGLQFFRTISHSRTALAAEILFLRKQVAYFQDHQIRPRRLRDASRLCLLFWSRLFDWPAALVSTFLRWHRKGFKWYWRWRSRGGRPPLPNEIRQLIARMVRENVTWGEERIADELSLKLGIYVSPRTVHKYWPQQPGMGSGRRRSWPWGEVRAAVRLPAHHGVVAECGVAGGQGSSAAHPAMRRPESTAETEPRGRLWLHDGSYIRLRPERANHVWSSTS